MKGGYWMGGKSGAGRSYVFVVLMRNYGSWKKILVLEMVRSNLLLIKPSISLDSSL